MFCFAKPSSLRSEHSLKIAYAIFLTLMTTFSPIITFIIGGEDGIRTHVGLHPNGFQDRPVMTTSVPLHIGWGYRTRTCDDGVKVRCLNHLANPQCKYKTQTVVAKNGSGEWDRTTDLPGMNRTL